MQRKGRDKMTTDEFTRFAMALKTYYPRDNVLPTKQAMALWEAQLQDLPYHAAAAMLNAWVATEKWSPTIAEIRSKTLEILHGEHPDWNQAWAAVIKAIQTYGYWQEEKAMAVLDDDTQAAVKTIGFYNICQSEGDAVNVVRAQFRQIYENISRRTKEHDVLPAPVKNAINKIAAEKTMKLEDKNHESL